MKTRHESLGRGTSGPYEDLFIYHVGGRIGDADEPPFGGNFLGNWIEDNTSFLFFSVPSKDIVSELLKKRGDLELIEDYHFTYEQWQGSWLKPITIEDFFIVPPWEEPEAVQGKITITLDPGVVFGTGLHPTTRDCLRALVYLYRQSPSERVVDLGTGTGILALAAAHLGARKVLAVDLNPLSVKTARKNVVVNHLENAIEVVEGEAEDFVDEPADLVMANLHYDVIANFLEKKGFQSKRWLIISGLMRSDTREVRSHLEKYSLQVVHEWDHEITWYTLLVKYGRWAP